MDSDTFLVHDDAHELAARSSVGRIESPQGTARGTGVLVERQLLLTCKHVVERILDCGLDHAWVRFGYKTGNNGVESGDVIELDLKTVVINNTLNDYALDYALVRIFGEPEYPIALLSNGWLNRMQNVRIVHHPRGEPLQISDIGQIIKVDKKYIQHNIKTDYGSSGAPIFDLNWHVVAIHRGNLGLSRSYAPGVTEGIPIYSIWNDIKSHLPKLVT
jgi:V8-like Glu-specific endopeptidase